MRVSQADIVLFDLKKALYLDSPSLRCQPSLSDLAFLPWAIVKIRTGLLL